MPVFEILRNIDELALAAEKSSLLHDELKGALCHNENTLTRTLKKGVYVFCMKTCENHTSILDIDHNVPFLIRLEAVK